MGQNNLAILISFLSLLVAALSIGWNIYRDVIMKARLRVNFKIALISHPTLPKPLERINITATNFGPGKIKCNMLQLKETSFLKKILKKDKHAVLINDYTDPLSSKLPCDLETGESANFFFKLAEDCVLSKDWTHVGISDSYGRIHWAPKNNIAVAKKSFKEKYAKVS
jgi:hypothetical protein